MMFPKKVKHRKWHKGRRRNTGVATRRTNLDFGTMGLKSMEIGWITSRQIEAARRTITRTMKKGGKLWIRIFPDRPVTTHGNENTMGGGKGSVDHYVAPIKSGVIMFELDGVTEEVAREAFVLASHKLPVKTKFIMKGNEML